MSNVVIGGSVTVTNNKGEVVTGIVVAYHEEQDCTVIKSEDGRRFAGIGILNDITDPDLLVGRYK